MKKLLALVILTFVNFIHAEISVVQNGLNLKVDIDGKLFTEYRNDQHVPCLYPLMSPSGTHLTRQFPFVKGVAGEQADHPHHIGFWFALGSVNGHDFWHGRHGERIVTTRLQHQLSNDHSNLRFVCDLEWIADNKNILNEKRVYSIHTQGDDRIIDVTLNLKATETDLFIGDTKEGGFALRIAPTMRFRGDVAAGRITNSKGILDNKAFGQRARWIAYHGPDSAGTPTVAAIFDHPDNLRHPTWWHARDYGLLTANPFGAKTYGGQSYQGEVGYRLKKSETLTLKYRLLLKHGDLVSADLEKLWAEFRADKSSDSLDMTTESSRNFKQ